MTLVYVVILAAMVVWAVMAFNRLIALKGQTLNGWKQIDVQLKRRHDLIPNLVNAVKGAMEFEKETLDAVISARNQAVKVQADTLPTGGVAALAQAEATLSSALSRLNVVVERYPDLKATGNVAQLQEELTSTENRVAFSRQHYNDIATSYNVLQEQFPWSLLTGERMSRSEYSEATRILTEFRDAGPSVVAAKLLPLVYDELRSLAAKYLRQERQGHTLDPTALVHEAFLRLVDQDRVDWQGRTHFYATCAEAMRRILIDYARARRRSKRGGNWRKVALRQAVSELAVSDFELVDFRDTLEKLASLDKRQARVVELRLFAGLTVAEVATVLRVSKRTVEGDWTHAKAWLRVELGQD